MKKRLSILLYILVIIYNSVSPVHGVYGEKLAAFPGIVNPDNFIIAGDRLYISEDAVISIYSCKDFSLVKRFGTEGEGPKEFFINRARGWDMLQIFIDNNQLVVNSSGTKFTYHTLDGEYIEETRLRLGYGVIEPFGNHFLATRFKTADNGDTYHLVSLYDEQFNKIKDIYEHKHGLQIQKKQPFNPLTTDHAFFQTCDDKIFVISGDRSIIHAFDKNGAKLFSIENKDELTKFTAEDKQDLIASYRNNKFWSRYYQLRKHLFKFPEYFPPISWFWLDPVKKIIYVGTEKREGDKRKLLVFDFKGKFIKKIMLNSWGMKIFNNGKYYQLIENEDEEMWELHVIEIN